MLFKIATPVIIYLLIILGATDAKYNSRRYRSRSTYGYVKYYQTDRENTDIATTKTF